MTRRFLFLLATLLAPVAASAQAPAAATPPFVAGKHYFLIEPAQPTATPGKVEVIEAFSYACVHCWNFQSKVDKWKKAAPANVVFSYLPAAFSPQYELYARGFYAAEALGLSEKTHGGVFDQVWVKKTPVKTLEDIGTLYTNLGVAGDDVVAAASSFAVQTKIKRSTAVLGRYGVEGTPTIVVNGKYRVTGASAGSYDNVFAVVDHLVALETAAVVPAPAQ